MKYRLSVITCLLAAAFLATSFPGQAQSLKKITLQEAIDLSIRNSKLLKNSQAKVDEAIAATMEAKERKLPDLSATGSYLHLNNPHVDLKTDKLSNGGNNGGGASGEPLKVSQAAYGLVNMSLPLFSGLRIQYGIQSAKYLEKAAKLDVEKDREDVIQNAIDAYSNLYKSKAAARLVQESLKQARQRAAEFSNLEKNGLLARNDLLKAELQASNIELSLLDAENNFRIATVNMNLLLGLDEGLALDPDSSGFQEPAGMKGLAEWEQTALQNRKDVEALSQREKAAVTGVKAIAGEKYPSVALTGGYMAAYVPNLVTLTNAVNVGLGLQYNIGSIWKSKSKLSQAQARVRQLQANEQMLDDAIRLQVNQSYQQVLLTRKKIEVYAKAVEQAAENYKITKNKYDNALVTTTDLLEAEVQQLQSRLDAAFSQVDHSVAYYKLLQAAGMLKEKNNQ